MDYRLLRFKGMYLGFFRRSHYVDHNLEEKMAAEVMVESLPLIEEPVVMNPVEAIGATKDVNDLIQRVSTMSIDEIAEQADRMYTDSFVTKSFFYYALAHYLKDRVDMTEIAEEARLF